MHLHSSFNWFQFYVLWFLSSLLTFHFWYNRKRTLRWHAWACGPGEKVSDILDHLFTIASARHALCHAHLAITGALAMSRLGDVPSGWQTDHYFPYGLRQHGTSSCFGTGWRDCRSSSEWLNCTSGSRALTWGRTECSNVRRTVEKTWQFIWHNDQTFM